MYKIILLIILVIVSLNLVSSISVNNVRIDEVEPGNEGIIKIELSNDGSIDVKDVSLNLNFLNNVIPIGSSEGFIDKIKENDEEEFAFRFKVSSNAIPGTYTIPYELSYLENNILKKQKGDLGIIISGQPKIEISIEPQNPVIGKTGTLQMKVINMGLVDAKFVFVSIEGQGLTFLSNKKEYIGTIDSDNFETASFEVVYNNKKPVVNIEINYNDFDNKERKINYTNYLIAYTEKEAIEREILEKNNLPIYFGVTFLVIVIWFIIKNIRKRQKSKKI